MHRVSVVVPTYNERENIEELVVRLYRAMHDSGYSDFEIVVVDDNSPDGTAEVVEALSRSYPVKLVRRPGKLGLGSAIMDGIRASSGNYVVVMDADLQHPPEIIPVIVKKLEEGYDVVVASRYITGGRIEGWSFTRRMVSRCATLLAYMLLPRVRTVKDPLSGFFGLRRVIIDGVVLEPHSFKILLEVLCKGRWRSVCEVPYVFRARQRGKSKLTLKEIIRYIKHLLKLTNYQPMKFTIVGASGIIVNSLVLYVLITSGIPTYVASPFAIEASIASNFILNEIWTFKDTVGGGVAMRFAKYHISVLVGALVNYAVFLTLVNLSIHYLIANLIGIFFGFIFNYLAATSLVWRSI